MKNLTKPKYKVGRLVELEKTFIDKDVSEYAVLTGDSNLIHLDDSYAATTRFKRRIVHGMQVAGLFGTIFGTIYPGAGAIYVSQELNFVKPVFVGDRVLAAVTLVKYYEKKSIGFFDINCKNQSNQIVIKGKTVLILP